MATISIIKEKGKEKKKKEKFVLDEYTPDKCDWPTKKKKEGKEREEKIGIWSDRSKLSDSLLISNPTINRFFF